MNKIKVEGGGITVTSAEYYAEADPRLMAIRERYLADEIAKDTAEIEIGKLVGQSRVDADMAPLRKQGLSDHGLISAFLVWQEKHPLACRLYGDPRVVIAVMLAHPEAVTVHI